MKIKIIIILCMITVIAIISSCSEKTEKTETPDNAAADQPAGINLFLPENIEKTFFEKKILAAITNDRAYQQIKSYYFIREGTEFYMLDPGISVREINVLLGYLREHTDLTGDDLYQMCVENNIAIPKIANPAYAHIRFGATEDILLLDEEQIKKIGQAGQNLTSDSNGYYVLNIFPHIPFVAYHDENGELRHELFYYDYSDMNVYSQEEYEDILENEIIPFCKILLANGLITQEEYDRFTVKNLFDYYVDLFFG